MSDTGDRSASGDGLFGPGPHRAAPAGADGLFGDEFDGAAPAGADGLFGDEFDGSVALERSRATPVRRVLDDDEPGRDGLPFRATVTAPLRPAPPIERLLDWIQSSRTWLVLGLAGVITVSVAAAYLQGTESGNVTLARRAEAPSVLAPTTAASTPGVAPSPTRLQGQALTTTIDAIGPESSRDRPATTRPLATSSPATDGRRSSTTTTTTAPSSTTETRAGPDTAPAEETSSTTATTVEASTSTTVPADTSTSSTGATPSTDGSPTSTSTSEPRQPSERPTRVEAETGLLLGTAAVRRDHEGFSGDGFVGDLYTSGSGVTLEVTSAVRGMIPFTVGYSAGKESGPAASRMLTVFVNGRRVIRADMAVTASWSDWDVVVGELPLELGANKITLVWSEGDSGWVNLDYIEIN